MKLGTLAILTTVVALTGMASAATPTGITLGSSSNPSNLSAAVTLTATVTPSTATGKGMFFDGVSPLGVAALFNGKSTFWTSLLASGLHVVKAFYAGDGANLPSTSPVLNQTVFSLAQKGFLPPVTVGGVSFPLGIVVSDFNGDGIADVAVCDFDINKMSVLIGNGDGTFQRPAGQREWNLSAGGRLQFAKRGSRAGGGRF